MISSMTSRQGPFFESRSVDLQPGAVSNVPAKSGAVNGPDLSETERLKKVLAQLSKQLKSVEKIASGNSVAQGEAAMLLSQIVSIQKDITSITNVSAGISSSENAKVALTEATNSAQPDLRQLLPGGQATAVLSAETSPQLKPLRLDLTGAFVDITA